MRTGAALLAIGLVGCTADTYLIVTVDQRPAVHGATRLEVSLSNAGTMRTDKLELGSHAFPVTFSISAPGRSGDLALGIDAFDMNNLLVGRGSGSATLADKTAAVTLDSTDFVVNSAVAGDQFLSDDFEANGLQLAAISDGTWTAAYRTTCTDCSVLGRRFDATGLPVQSGLASSDMEFPISTMLTTSGSIPAVASSGVTTMVFWDYASTSGTGQGVECRALDAMGNALTAELSLPTTDTADVVTATPLSNGNFAVTWQTFTTSEIIRTIIAKPDCSAAIANPLTVSNTPALTAHRSHVASNMDNVMYAWIVDGDVHIRPASNLAVFGVDAQFVLHTATSQIDYVRVAPLGTGFAVVVRWSALDSVGPGKIELYRASPAGLMTGGATLITDQSLSDFTSDQSFGVATRADGALMIVWHQCPTGPGSCDVYGRVVRPSGVPVGDPFPLATSTTGDQVNPSVVGVPDAFVAAWNDSSGTEPDHSGTAVRARVLSPPYDSAAGILGAPCGGGQAACGTGLACAQGSDGMRCFTTCIAGAPPPTCPAGGTCSPADASTSACTF